MSLLALRDAVGACLLAVATLCALMADVGVAQGDRSDPVQAMMRALEEGDAIRAGEALAAGIQSDPGGRAAFDLLISSMNRARAAGLGQAWLDAMDIVRAKHPLQSNPANLAGFVAGRLKLIERAEAAFESIPPDAQGPAMRRTAGDLASAGYDSAHALTVLDGRADEVGQAQRAYHERLQEERAAAASTQTALLLVGFLGFLVLVLLVGRRLG